MRTFCKSLAAAVAIVLAAGSLAHAQKEPDHIRGKILSVDGGAIVVETRESNTVKVIVPDEVTVIALNKGRWQSVDFGVYVGSVAKKLEEFSPIVRDSMSWLHKGYEFRIIDEQLRGIALGHQKWDLTNESIMAHGWVDDIEGRVLSIKYGPTEEEETDVEVPRDVPVLAMSLGDKSLIKEGTKIFVGAQKNDDGDYVAVFIFAGLGDSEPGL